MVWSPASSEIATKGMPRQTLAAIRLHRAGHAEPMKSMFVSRSPSLIMPQEMMENWGS